MFFKNHFRKLLTAGSFLNMGENNMVHSNQVPHLAQVES